MRKWSRLTGDCLAAIIDLHIKTYMLELVIKYQYCCLQSFLSLSSKVFQFQILRTCYGEGVFCFKPDEECMSVK